MLLREGPMATGSFVGKLAVFGISCALVISLSLNVYQERKIAELQADQFDRDDLVSQLESAHRDVGKAIDVAYQALDDKRNFMQAVKVLFSNPVGSRPGMVITGLPIVPSSTPI